MHRKENAQHADRGRSCGAVMFCIINKWRVI
nr:MAG TPA: hypothetical protein [Caudoviricetes sp.]